MTPSAAATGQLEPGHGFVVGCGIECSAPVIAGGIRQDELVKTGHWTRYAEDLALVAAFGSRYLRYGVPFHVAWDLTYGRWPSDSVVAWLAANGLGEDRLAWFAEHGSSEGCIVGHDYYAGNERIVAADGTTTSVPVAEERGYAEVAREHHAHFGLPFMLSETNNDGPRVETWLARTWNDTLRLREDGLPIRGYIWYGFVDHVDWDSALRVAAGNVNSCGLVDPDRRPHPWGETYRGLAQAALRGEFSRLDERQK